MIHLTPNIVGIIAAVAIALVRLVPLTRPLWGKLPTWARTLPQLVVIVAGTVVGVAQTPGDYLNQVAIGLGAIVLLYSPGALPEGARHAPAAGCIFLLAGLLLGDGACVPTPAPNPPPDATSGGTPSGATGGAGGWEPAWMGGSPGAGGTTSPCPVVDYPDTPLPQTLSRKIVRHKLTPRHLRPHGRALSVMAAVLPSCSGGALPLVVTPLDQVDGSCTGAAGVGMISSPPFKSAAHFNIPDSLLAYQGGTCEDNGCAKCSCSACPAAYCPATHANDTGSNGSSVAKWMVEQKWLPGYLAADNTDALMAGLSIGKTCIIGIDWLDSMWTPDPVTGEIKVDLATTLQGGHELHTVLSDVARGRVWVRNSWGAWGWCYKSQMTQKSSTDGTGCGYAWLSVKNLPALRYDADCPS